MFHQNLYQTIAQEKQEERKRFVENPTRNQEIAADPDSSRLAQSIRQIITLRHIVPLLRRLLAAVPRPYLRNLASNSSWDGTSSPTE